MKKEKILFLTLGTGVVSQSPLFSLGLTSTKTEIRRKLRRNESNYKTTKYITPSGKKYEREAFVAKPIIDEFKPDKIYVIGTVRSCWDGFLAYFYDRSAIDEKGILDDLLYLNSLKDKYGESTNSKQLKEIENEINRIFNRAIDRKMAKGTISVVITRYGTDDKQIDETYARLNSIWSELGDDKGYEVAIDITHSFRSMPLYNVVISNYQKNIENKNIEITHVYYGNLEVKNEMPGQYAPIVDLGKIVNILDLTNGVAEFKNTGSPTTLIKALPDESKEFKALLKEFQWSLYFNDIRKTNDSIKAIMAYASHGRKSSSPVDMAEAWVLDVIKNDFLDGHQASEFSKISNEERRRKNLVIHGSFQLIIAGWYLKHEMYGEMLIPTNEALKNLLTKYLLEDTNLNIGSWEVDNGDIKKQLDFAVNNLDSSTPDNIKALLRKLRKRNNDVVTYRNKYAHYLPGQVKESAEQIEKNIKEYYDCVVEVEKLVREGNVAFRKALTGVTIKPKAKKKDAKGKVSETNMGTAMKKALQKKEEKQS